MSIKYSYNRTGTERKALVEAVSRILEKPAVYLGAPTFAYAVGDYRISKKGSLFCMNDTGREEIERLVLRLEEQGFIAENSSTEDSPTAETGAEYAPEETAEPVDEAAGIAAAENAADEAASDDSHRVTTVTIEIPKAGFTDSSLDNLQKIIASKAGLLRKAIGTDNLEVIDTGASLRFPWFTRGDDADDAFAYCQLVSAMCDMARKRKRVTAKVRDTDNAKFDMRLFLVQLGFIGDEYKAARRILLKNLTGNSSWKSGHAPVRDASNTEAGPAPQPETEGGEAYGK